MKHIDRIRSQPQHIRELWVVGCTVVVVLIIVAIWFRSFNNNVYALLNPGQAPAPEQNIAANGGGLPAGQADTSASLFGSIGQAIQDAKAEISGLLNFSSSVSTNQSADGNAQPVTGGPVHALPVSGNR